MSSRRDFLKNAALLTGAAGLSNALPPSIQKAFAINPAAGTTFLDAEHVVILMQENRSFDHCFGTLQGVRGFNDPRAIRLPDGNPVWLQRNEKGETYSPFRLNINDTKATWMGSLPHSWTDQTDARNNGLYDQWLKAKKSGNKEYHSLPLTLGYYNREDLPFYYSLADAFTVCDQNFCSSLTGTTPNRLHLWTGTIRENSTSPPRVRNAETDYGAEASWKTFPERLEENGVSWRVYQNEISVGVGFTPEEDAWLANFTDNPLEWFTQYGVRYSNGYIRFLPKRIYMVENEIMQIDEKLNASSPKIASYGRLLKEKAAKQTQLKALQAEQQMFSIKKYNELTQAQRNLHEKAFTTNSADSYYHSLASLAYADGQTEREMKVPAGDILYQFRKDVDNGKLPTVSWLVPPENYSDHPGAPWYGAWYVSEVMDILTKNPEVWKKTIFIICYDENDGYFDHVPPFVPPHPTQNNGKTSLGIDTSGEYVSMELELARVKKTDAREGPIGLGYRVPLVIVSPWSRGGLINSEVFDHTSILKFLEIFTSRKSGKKIEETNISAWRRCICGDLTSAFQSYNGEAIKLPTPLHREEFLAHIHQSQFKDLPKDFQKHTTDEITAISKAPEKLPAHQERGVRKSSPLSYELKVDGRLTADGSAFEIAMQAGKDIFGTRSMGAPFQIYVEGSLPRYYAVKAGDKVVDLLPLPAGNTGYKYQLYGPNGFFRVFKGNANNPKLTALCVYQKSKDQYTGNVEFHFTNTGDKTLDIAVEDMSYKSKTSSTSVKPGKTEVIKTDLSKNLWWYDFVVKVNGFTEFEQRYAGRVESGKPAFSDPAMGRAI